MNYKLTRYTSYMQKSDVIAVYSSFDLMFFKNDTAKWFEQIVNDENTENIPKSFIEYLKQKEVIEIG